MEKGAWMKTRRFRLLADYFKVQNFLKNNYDSIHAQKEAQIE